MEELMKADPPLTQEAWHCLQGWYKATVDRPLPPARATLKRVTAEQTTLYSQVPPLGDTIPVTIEPFAVEDGVPSEAEVEWAVKRLRNNRAGGPLRMRAEDLKGWLAAARREEKEREARTKDGGDREGDQVAQTEAEGHWGRVVEIVQTAFWEGELAEEVTWQAVVLIPKRRGDYRGIGLVEVMWKVRRQFKITATTFHITSTRRMPR